MLNTSRAAALGSKGRASTTHGAPDDGCPAATLKVRGVVVIIILARIVISVDIVHQFVAALPNSRMVARLRAELTTVDAAASCRA